MFALIYMLTVMFIAIILEVLLGAYGFWIPVTGYLVFYITVVWRWQIGAVSALLMGMCIDLLYFRQYMYSAVLLLIVVLIATIWLIRADDKVWWMRVFPGMIIGGIYVIPQSVYNSFFLGWYPDLLLRNILSCFFVIILSGTVFPMFIGLLDAVAEHLGTSRFNKAREQIIHSR